MTSFSLHEKVSGHEIKAWYLSSLGVDTSDGEAAWDSFMDHKPVEFKVPKKPRASKKSSTPSERADMDFDDTKCGARIWLKGGLAAQCSCKHVTNQFLCKKHQTECDKNDGKVANGFYNADKPTHKYNDETNDQCWWEDQLEVWETQKKPKKSTVVAAKTQRKCSCCGETGHNKSKCPNKSVSNTPPAKSKTVDEIKAELAEAEARVVAEAEAVDKDKVVDKKKKEKKEKKKKKKKSKNSMKVEAAKVDTENPVETPAELEEDDKTVAYGGEEIEEAQTVTYGGDVADLKDVEDVEEQAKEIVEQEIVFKFEGVTYTRNTKTSKVEDDDCDQVGTWNNESQEIEFTESGKRTHKMSGDREVPESDSGSDSDSDEE